MGATVHLRRLQKEMMTSLKSYLDQLQLQEHRDHLRFLLYHREFVTILSSTVLKHNQPPITILTDSRDMMLLLHCRPRRFSSTCRHNLTNNHHHLIMPNTIPSSCNIHTLKVAHHCHQ